MPIPLTSHKSKPDLQHDICVDYAYLGLHDACATGNVGLAKYALSKGQPVNSVLDGVLPLHAACAGGSDIIVKLLVEYGADVNAPRLPSKHSNDKNRAHTIIGTTGATPLHFAAANGHTAIVGLLLSLGANPEATDKGGIRPLQLAIDNGHEDVMSTLSAWAALHPYPHLIPSPTAPRFSNEARAVPIPRPPQASGSSSLSSSAPGKHGLLNLLRKASGDLVSLSRKTRHDGADDDDSDSDLDVGQVISTSTPTSYQTAFAPPVTSPAPLSAKRTPPPHSPASSSGSWYRPRQGSEVLSRSPLATEWRRDLPDEAQPPSSPAEGNRSRGSSFRGAIMGSVGTRRRNGRPSTGGSAADGRGRGGSISSFVTSDGGSGGSTYLHTSPTPTPARSDSGDEEEFGVRALRPRPPRLHARTRSADHESPYAVSPRSRREHDRRQLESEFDLEFTAPAEDDAHVDELDLEEHDDDFDPDGARAVPVLPDLRAVASHAQAEALVERSRAVLLSLDADSLDVEALAAYGETLALEKRFRRGEAQRVGWTVREESDDEGMPPRPRVHTLSSGAVDGPYFVNRKKAPLRPRAMTQPQRVAPPSISLSQATSPPPARTSPSLDTTRMPVSITRTLPTPVDGQEIEYTPSAFSSLQTAPLPSTGRSHARALSAGTGTGIPRAVWDEEDVEFEPIVRVGSKVPAPAVPATPRFGGLKGLFVKSK